MEILLTSVCLSLAVLLYAMQGYKMVILNLFFLPVALAGFYLGRYRAGILALFSALAVSGVTALVLDDLATANSPVVIALAIAVWAATLGLAALLIGTLSDDRAAKTKDLHDAYVGVVDVLSQYLQSGHPRLKARSIRVAELSQEVGLAMHLLPRQIDNIRVAALLYDVGHIEITTRVVRRAVDLLEESPHGEEKWTFQGRDFVLSLGPVLTDAIPLVLNQDRELSGQGSLDPAGEKTETPFGARIIRIVRSYVGLASETAPEAALSSAEICRQLRSAVKTNEERQIVDVLEGVVSRPNRASPPVSPRPIAPVVVPAPETSGTPC
jgi:HD-GYP domain-containing protein (c-di-GMP phosphodiesterase class II)